jgi:hypothetical protein
MDFDSLYYIIDEFLKNSFHKEDKQVTMNDSEIIFSYIVSCQYFSGNYFKTLYFLKESKLMSKVLSSSRFSRRLNRLKDKIYEILGFLYGILKEVSSKEFCIDSYPVPICRYIRMRRSRLIKGKEYIGFNAVKEEYYFGFKVHLVISREGGVVEFNISAASSHDLVGLKSLNLDLPKDSELFGDKAYTDSLQEELLKDCASIKLSPIRKANSKKSDNKPYVNYYRQCKRKIVETIISQIQGLFPKKIHATNIDGFILKLAGFILSYNFSIII